MSRQLYVSKKKYRLGMRIRSQKSRLRLTGIMLFGAN